MYGSIEPEEEEEEEKDDGVVLRKRKRYLSPSVPVSFSMIGFALVLIVFAIHNVNTGSCENYYIWFLGEAMILVVLGTIDRMCKMKTVSCFRNALLFTLWAFLLVWFSAGSQIFLDVDLKDVTCRRMHGLGFFITILCIIAVIVYLIRMSMYISIAKNSKWSIDTTIASVTLFKLASPRLLILPFVFARLGWISILLTIFMCIWKLYITTSLHNIVCSMDRNIVSYPEIANLILGNKSSIHIRIIQRLERVLICICMVWFVLEDVADMSLGSKLTSSWNVVIIGSLLIFSTLELRSETLNMFRKVSMWSFVTMLVMLYAESIRRIALDESDEDVESTEIVQNEPRKILTIATFALLSCFSIQDETWQYRDSMRNPEDFSIVLYVSSLCSLFVYITFASTVYVALGDHASSDVVSSLDTQSGGIFVLISMTISMFTLFVSESRISIDKSNNNDSNNSTIVSRVTICVLCIGVAVFCPVDLTYYLALIGVLCVLPLVVFYPLWILLRS